jgi:hypothetical protein
MRSSLLFVTCLVAAGCSVSSPYMNRSAQPQAIRASAENALVVFVRPSRLAGGVGANILDEEGRFLGDSLAGSHFAVAMKPGPHMFVVWAENTDMLTADLAPGRVYYVEVAPSMGAFSAQMHLYAIKPGRKSWDRLSEWMAKSEEFTPNLAAGQSNLDRRAKDVAERLRRAREHAGRYSGEKLLERTLAPTDGVAG